MRGIPSLITDIRKKVFTEVARMAYSGEGYGAAEELPYIIVPGDQPLHRESVFLERAIASERVRLAMGLNLRPIQTRHLMTEGMDHAAIAEQYYEPPLINIIPYACPWVKSPVSSLLPSSGAMPSTRVMMCQLARIPISSAMRMPSLSVSTLSPLCSANRPSNANKQQ